MASPSNSGLSSARIQPGECSRLKRPLELSSSASKKAKGSGHHSARKGFWTGQHKGVSRASYLSLTEPVDTPAELDLFDTLSKNPLVKMGTDLDFVIMAKLWNNEVIRLLTVPQEAGMQGLDIRPKTERHLRAFHKEACQTICSRRAAGVAEALSGVAAADSPSMAPSAQACLGVMRSLITIANAAGPSAPPRAATTAPTAALNQAASTRRMFPSTVRENKINNQGGGAKKCMCGWRAAVDGTGIGLGQHRKLCVPYIAAHPKKK